MCLSDKEYRAWEAMGEEKWKKAKSLKYDHMDRLRGQIEKMKKELESMEYMNAHDYSRAYLEPPKKKVAVHKFPGKGNALDASYDEKDKLVFVDILKDADGQTMLCAVDKNGKVIDNLLSFASDGVVDRHVDISPKVGLALGRDGSLRGRIKA